MTAHAPTAVTRDADAAEAAEFIARSTQRTPPPGRRPASQRGPEPDLHHRHLLDIPAELGVPGWHYPTF